LQKEKKIFIFVAANWEVGKLDDHAEMVKINQ